MSPERRLAGLALLLPAFGALLLTRPLIDIFDAKARLFGLPRVVVYLFGVWLVLIVLAYLFSRLLPKDGEDRPPDRTGRGAGGG
ncbi:hypothetical protein HDIA_1917 [Hartmannibacter diazotrophicus]|uniref:DUF3311 domain-containing protein n=1 Tax=Hartmannibacter diazotrophicus TaxID=1482074 RepID=A0A2C9D5P1_9HYPH|nr:hypothetical protein [Hartmannibacter diazotrophicus]SON55458.1 hypothetical protein HDIA_1917 [Hartmannibacter diazotrophicus]